MILVLMFVGVVIARSPLQEDVRKVVEGERPMPPAESGCMAQFQVNANTIIRTKDSRSQGAKYLNETELPSKGDCLLWCCQVTSCNVAVFEEKDRGSCYLFDCGTQTDFKCTFTSHNQYTSAVLDTTQRRPVAKWKPSDEHIEALKSLKSESAEEYIQQTNLPIATTTQVPDVFQPNQPPTNIPSTSHSTPERRCSQFQFECRTNFECIAIYNACDGIPQCSDGSDESNDLGCPPAGRRWLGPPEPPAPSSALGGASTTGSDPNFADHAQVGGWQERETMTPSASSNNENNEHVRNLLYPHGANQPATGIVDSNESGHREANSRSRPLADVQEASRPGKSHSRSSFNEGSNRWNSDVRPSPPPPLPPPPPPPKHEPAAVVQTAADVDDSSRGRQRYHNVAPHESTDGYPSWQQQNHGSQRHNNAGSVFSHKSNNLPDGSVSMRSRPGAMSKLHQVPEDNENSRGYFDNGYDSAPHVDDSDTHYNGNGGNENAAREYYESDFPSQKKPNPAQPVPAPHYSDEYMQRQDGSKNGWPKLTANEEYKVPSGPAYRDYPESVADNKNQQKHFQSPGRHGNPQWANGKDRNNNDYGKPNGDQESMTRERWRQDPNAHMEPISKGQNDQSQWNANHKENFNDNDHPQLANPPEADTEVQVKQQPAEHAVKDPARYTLPQQPVLPKGNTSVTVKDKGNSVTEVTSSIARVLPQAQPRLSQAELNLAQMESEDGDKSPQSSGAAVLALTLGLSVTGLLLVLVGCRLRRVRRRMMRRGRSPYAHDADYLVNGMYL